MSEKKAELWVFNELVSKGYTNAAMHDVQPGLHVWAEQSDVPIINQLLAKASKKGTDNKGYPEYIIYEETRKLVIVIEDKKNRRDHVSSDDFFSNTAKYAVNGALWYASFLKEEFDVVAIGCSGQGPDNILIDTFAWRRGLETFTNLNLHEILPVARYLACFDHDRDKQASTDKVRELLHSAKDINDFMQNQLGVIEHNRLYILGAILLSLEDPVFKSSYSLYNNNRDIADFLWSTVERKLKAAQITEKELFTTSLKPVLLSLQQEEKKSIEGSYAKGTLHKLVLDIDQLLYKHYKDSELDLISLFFNTFLSYTTKGGSDLGIVLTPPHITKMFSEMAHVSPQSRVLDICAGTAGFLTAAWRKVALSPNYTQTEKEQFRRNNLFGVEVEPSIYIVSCLNMFLNKDGKSHLYNRDCFRISEELRNQDCTVGFLNPPYSNKAYSEIAFVELMLDTLLPDSIGIAIVPVNAVSSRTKIHNDNDSYKERILKKHTLLASIEMPKNLFFPKGTETVVLVFRTGVANEGQQTWFAKFDDGYELLKHQKTRTPGNNSEALMAQFLDDYEHRAETNHSFLRGVAFDEQWVYTLFADNDYQVTPADLQQATNEYIAYLFSNQYDLPTNLSQLPPPAGTHHPVVKKVQLVDYFEIVPSRQIDKMNTTEADTNDIDAVPFLSRSDRNNGMSGYVEKMEGKLNVGGCISVALDGSTGATFYQHHPFMSGQNIWLLKPYQARFSGFDPFIALYCVASIRKAVKHYTYNLSLTKTRLKNISIFLPVHNDGKVDTNYIKDEMMKLRHANLIETIPIERYQI